MTTTKTEKIKIDRVSPVFLYPVIYKRMENLPEYNELTRLLESNEPIKPNSPAYEYLKNLMKDGKKKTEFIDLPDFTGTEKKKEFIELPDFTKFRKERDEKNESIEYLTEEENAEVDRWVRICEDEHNGDPMDEGFLGKLFGGAAGFILGPTVGKVIARALGVEKGVLYDMLTSRVVSAALGVAIAKKFGGEYKE